MSLCFIVESFWWENAPLGFFLCVHGGLLWKRGHLGTFFFFNKTTQSEIGLKMNKNNLNILKLNENNIDVIKSAKENSNF